MNEETRKKKTVNNQKNVESTKNNAANEQKEDSTVGLIVFFTIVGISIFFFVGIFIFANKGESNGNGQRRTRRGDHRKDKKTQWRRTRSKRRNQQIIDELDELEDKNSRSNIQLKQLATNLEQVIELIQTTDSRWYINTQKYTQLANLAKRKNLVGFVRQILKEKTEELIDEFRSRLT